MMLLGALMGMAFFEAVRKKDAYYAIYGCYLFWVAYLAANGITPHN